MGSKSGLAELSSLNLNNRGTSDRITMDTSGYVKHVSFDDLAPTLIDDQVDILKHSKKPVGFNNQFLHIPPQFNPLYHVEDEEPAPKNDMFTKDHGSTSHKSQDDVRMKMMLQFMSAPDALKSSMRSQDFVDRSRSSSPRGMARNSHKLPPPPKVPSIRKMDRRPDESWDITDYDVANMGWQAEKNLTRETEKNTQSNSGSSHGYTQAAFANLNELEDRLDPSSNLAKTPTKEEKNDRKKSFAGMSDQELADLENFYESQSRSTSTPTIEKYDFKQQDPFFVDNFKKKGTSQIVDPLAPIYPSRPVVDHRAVSVTIENAEYDQFVEDFNTRTGSRKPEESLAAIRNVNCYISGRRYTWSSVDWYVENCAQDGDHLAIVTSIPFFEREVEDSTYELTRRHFVESHSDYGSFDDHDKELGRVSTSSSDQGKPNASNLTAKGLRIKAIHEEAKDSCLRVLKYYASRLKGKKIKITVEMIKCESPDFAVTRAAALYKPDIQIVSTVSTNLQIKFRNGKVKLPFFVMRHYAMSTAVVPYEFIDPKKLGEETTNGGTVGDERKGIPKGDERLATIDNIILKTLKNPFQPDNSPKKDLSSGGDSEVDSLNEYFPMSPEQKRKYDMFEKTGYVRCPPTRQNYMNTVDPSLGSEDRLTPFSTGNNSRRSSRIQYDEGIYKVKSLIADSSDDDEDKSKRQGTSIRKTKSMGPITKSKSKSPTLSPTTSIGRAHRTHLHTTGTKAAESASPLGERNNKKNVKHKEKKSLGSFFRKVFK